MTTTATAVFLPAAPINFVLHRSSTPVFRLQQTSQPQRRPDTPSSSLFGGLNPKIQILHSCRLRSFCQSTHCREKISPPTIQGFQTTTPQKLKRAKAAIVTAQKQRLRVMMNRWFWDLITCKPLPKKKMQSNSGDSTQMTAKKKERWKPKHRTKKTVLQMQAELNAMGAGTEESDEERKQNRACKDGSRVEGNPGVFNCYKHDPLTPAYPCGTKDNKCSAERNIHSNNYSNLNTRLHECPRHDLAASNGITLPPQPAKVLARWKKIQPEDPSSSALFKMPSTAELDEVFRKSVEWIVHHDHAVSIVEDQGLKDVLGLLRPGGTRYGATTAGKWAGRLYDALQLVVQGEVDLLCLTSTSVAIQGYNDDPASFGIVPWRCVTNTLSPWKSLVKIVQDPTKVTVKHAVTIGLTKFNAYYDPMKTKKCYIILTPLSPCYQLKFFNKLGMDVYKLIEGKVKQEYIRKQNATTEDSNSTALEDLSECEDGVTVGLHKYDRFNLTAQLGEGQTDLNYWKALFMG
ncbi:hypothetical protein BT69DRAFT_1299537 [Atractiella rhizophila]|nr:hypothetical protein BT69DRAFT_1299537 [Atractiella rhizophila]